MSIKKNTLDTITANKARQIYKKELAGMSAIWLESSWELNRGASAPDGLDASIQSSWGLAPGANCSQQTGKTLTGNDTGPIRRRGPEVFVLPFLPLHPVAAFSLTPSLLPQAGLIEPGVYALKSDLPTHTTVL